MDENELYERKREEALNELQRAYEEAKSALTEEEREVFEKAIDCLSLVSTGVDAAHRRIAMRKEELEGLKKSLHRVSKSQSNLIEAINLFSAMQSKETNELKNEFQTLSKANSRFIKLVMVSFVIVVVLITSIVLGNQNILGVLDGLTTMLKTVNVIV